MSGLPLQVYHQLLSCFTDEGAGRCRECTATPDHLAFIPFEPTVPNLKKLEKRFLEFGCGWCLGVVGCVGWSFKLYPNTTTDSVLIRSVGV